MARRFRRKSFRKRRPRRRYATRGKRRGSRWSHQRCVYFKSRFVHTGIGGNVSANNLFAPTTTGGTTTQETNFSFRLGHIPYFARITNLYDVYKIVKIVLDWIPVGADMNPYPNAVSTNVAIPTIVTAIDHDDTNNVGIAIYSYGYCKERSCKSRFRTTIYPRIAKAAFGGGLLSSYANDKPGWIDTDFPNVDHYGLRSFFPAIQNLSGPTHAYRIIATYYVCCKEFRSS